MSPFVKTIARLIETDMSVMSHTKELQIHPVQRFDQSVISAALFIRILCQTIWQVSIVRINVYLIKRCLCIK